LLRAKRSRGFSISVGESVRARILTEAIGRECLAIKDSSFVLYSRLTTVQRSQDRR
jgi:hypothetical protein